MTVSPIMSMDALAAPVEETIIHQKFGEMALPWLSPQSMWPATGQFRWDWDWSALSRSPLSSALQELLGGLVPRTLKLLAMSLLSLSPSSTLSSLCSASNLLLLLRILPNHIWNLELSLTLPSKSLAR